MAGTFLDLLPTEDILHGCIFSLLDYESRINLNRIMPPNERYVNKFLKPAILGHDGKICMLNIKSHLNYIDNRSNKKIKRCKKIISLLKVLITDRYIQFILNFPKFKEAIQKKMVSFCDPASPDINSASKYFKKKIRDISTILLNKLNTATKMNSTFKLNVIHICEDIKDTDINEQ